MQIVFRRAAGKAMPSDAHKIFYYITEVNIKNFVLFARKPKDNQLWMLMVMQNQTEMNKKERNKKGAVERERERANPTRK